MHYVMADIHGEYDRYIAMLKRIAFSDQDTLYIIGDVIDRNPCGVDILVDIMSRKNCIMLKGNHEEMCLGTLGPNSVFGYRTMWQQNGGRSTRHELLYCRTREERMAIIKFLDSLPEHLEVEVNGRTFYLVHGAPISGGDGPLWERVMPDSKSPFPDKTVIVGHTQTCYLKGEGGHPTTPMTIWHGDGIIDIDCGCGNQTPHRRLACLRLEDMAEFYV